MARKVIEVFSRGDLESRKLIDSLFHMPLTDCMVVLHEVADDHLEHDDLLPLGPIVKVDGLTIARKGGRVSTTDLYEALVS